MYDENMTAKEEAATALREPRVQDKEMSMLAEALMANDRMLMDCAELVGELTRRLQPVINDKRDDSAKEATDSSAGLYAPVTNNVMSHGDAISAINRRLRNLLKTLEV